MPDGTAIKDPATCDSDTGLTLHLVGCPLCGTDEAEPVAVGNDFAHGCSADSFLAVRCSRCQLVYLNPRPGPEGRARIYPADYFSRAGSGTSRLVGTGRGVAVRTVRRCGSLAPEARVLVAAYGGVLQLEPVCQAARPGWTVEALTPHDSLTRAAHRHGAVVHQGSAQSLAGRDGAYDIVFFLDALEHCERPVEELRAMRGLLRVGGRLILLTQNVDSAVGRVFRGRHWAGYDFPRHACLYGPDALRRLGQEADLVVERLGTVRSPDVWVRSAAQLLDDWRAPAWLKALASPRSPLAHGAAILAEFVAEALGKGAALEAVLRRPADTTQ